MTDLDPAVREHLAAAGRKGARRKWDNRDAEARGEATKTMRASRAKVPVLEADLAALRAVVQRLESEVAGLRSDRVAA